MEWLQSWCLEHGCAERDHTVRIAQRDHWVKIWSVDACEITTPLWSGAHTGQQRWATPIPTQYNSSSFRWRGSSNSFPRGLHQQWLLTASVAKFVGIFRRAGHWGSCCHTLFGVRGYCGDCQGPPLYRPWGPRWYPPHSWYWQLHPSSLFLAATDIPAVPVPPPTLPMGFYSAFCSAVLLEALNWTLEPFQAIFAHGYLYNSCFFCEKWRPVSPTLPVLLMSPCAFQRKFLSNLLRSFWL